MDIWDWVQFLGASQLAARDEFQASNTSVDSLYLGLRLGLKRIDSDIGSLEHYHSWSIPYQPWVPEHQ